MIFRKPVLLLFLHAVLVPGLHGIFFTIDYTYDDGNFFGAGNPDGALAGSQAKAALERAASDLEVLFDDNFSAITPGGMNTWTASFFDPEDSTTTLNAVDLTIAQDEILVYTGGSALAGSVAGRGGPGGFSATGLPSFLTSVKRNQPGYDTATPSNSTDFGPWGGSVTFDNDGSTNYHYDHTSSVGSGLIDFYSVALHELVHVLGFGTCACHENLVDSSSNWTGSEANGEYGGSVPMQNSTGDHFSEGVMSVALSDGTAQETLMDPTITAGTRKEMSYLDLLAMVDAGWESSVTPIPEPGHFGLIAGVLGLVLLARRVRGLES